MDNEDKTLRTMQFEELGGRRMFSVKLHGLKKFEKRMLRESGCPFFLPMRFMKEEDNELAYYDFTGCVSLREYLLIKEALQEKEGKTAGKILDMIGSLLECLRGMEKYLIFPDDVSIDPDVVYVDAETGKAKLAYLPNPEPENPLIERIIASFEKMADISQAAEAKEILTNLNRQIRQKNPGLEGMIGILDTVKRNLYYIYWEPENFRNCEKNEMCSNDPESLKESGFETKKNEKPCPVIKNRLIIPFLVGASAICLAGAYFSGLLDTESFAGLAILTAGGDLMIIRRIAPDILNVRKYTAEVSRSGSLSSEHQIFRK